MEGKYKMATSKPVPGVIQSPEKAGRSGLGSSSMLLAALLTINVTITCWICNRDIDNGERIVIIETSLSDADDNPPAWFVRRVDKIDSSLEKLAESVNAHLSSGQHTRATATR